ncbi:MAG: glutaminase [Clostridia bacterium]|nr:glutaminase [Clostridia bacterium]
MSCQASIETVFETVRSQGDQGEPASYIPELARVNPDKFGVCLTTIDNRQFCHGDANDRFSIQSITKVLALSLAYKMVGVKIWERIGVEPSGSPFNSLVQLETDNGKPRNPFINAGALVICDFLISHLENPKTDFIAFVRNVADSQDMDYSLKMAESEKSVGYRNIALCYFIKSFGNIKNHPQEVLDFYFLLCSIEMSCKELSKTFLFLANQGRKTSDNTEILNSSQAKRINAIMQTCGFYDESGEFAYEVGLPGKSGVGGGIIAIHPNKYSIAVWSPRLNQKGNSYRGMKFLELFTTETASSIF